MIAFRPIRPTDEMSPTLAMPVTTTQKISGAMTILISLMKPSPSGRRSAPRSGKKWPRAMPATTATNTWKNSDL